ncbi:hypothetical protein B0A49_11860, partial [Cryomyces minteri]
DRLSKMRHLIPCTSETDAKLVAKLYLRHVWKLHGLPSSVVSDRGPQFVAQFWQSLCTRLGTKARLSSAYHPESDGQTENANGVMEQYLRAHVSYLQDDWVDWLPMAEFTANNAPSATTQVSPFYANYGFDPRMGFEPPQAQPENVSRHRQIQHQAAEEFATRMEAIRDCLRTEMQYAQSVYEDRANSSRSPAPAYKVGDKVWLNTRNIHTERPSKKLDWKATGPHTVKAVISPYAYELDLPSSMKDVHPVFHTSLLRPATGDPLPGQVNAVPPPVVVNGEEEWEVDEIYDSRIIHRQLQYLVKWTGDNVPSWQPASFVTNATDLLADFYQRYPNKPGHEHCTQQWLPDAHNSARNWVLNSFEKRKLLVKQKLYQARSRINISFDLWNGSNDTVFVAVVAHWIDEARTLKTALLGLPVITGQHTGGRVAEYVLGVLKEYEIEHRVLAFTLDNASNNDTCLEALAETLPHLSPSEHQMRCLGHIFNLVVKSILLGKGLGQTQKALAGAGDKGTFDIWRKQDPVGKLHNVAKYINRTESRQEQFKIAQMEVNEEEEDPFLYKLVQDGGVRWNATFDMIDRGLQLEMAIEFYCRRWKRPSEKDSYNLSQDFLTPDDWNQLRRFHELLKPFRKATKRVEGNATHGAFGALWEVLPSMDYCFEKLKTAAESCETEPDDQYRIGVDLGFKKLKFRPSWITAVKRTVTKLFERYLDEAVEQLQPELVESEDEGSEDSDDDYNRLFSTKKRPARQRTDTKRRKLTDELERFMDDEELLTKTQHKYYRARPLGWWRAIGEKRFPVLATMAYDLFAIPGMSSECERVFSHAKRMETGYGTLSSLSLRQQLLLAKNQ